MKKNIIATIILFAFVSLFSLQVSAQKKDYIPEKGYWVLVSNTHQKKIVTVQFYSDDHKLMYQETLQNAGLNVERKKVRRQLYSALKETYQIWAATNTVPSAKDIIARRIKN